MKNKVTLLLIVLVASFFRLYQLGSIPIELNRDEASIGYTAFSLLKTGADEYGRKWPLNVESFGDWKLPVYQWCTIPSVAVFGLSAWAVRLPSAIAGIISVYLIYQLFLLLSNQLKMRQSYALLIAFLLAILPWHIHFSRMAYEANLAVTLFLLGLIAFLHFLEHTKRMSLFLSGFCFGLTMITYHAFQLVTPLFLLLLLITYKTEVQRLCKRHLSYFFLFFIILIFPVLLLLMSGVTNSNQVKLSGLSIFEEQTYYQRLFTNRQFFSDNQGVIAKLYANIPMEFTRQVLVNSTTALNPDFLIINGGGHGSHDIVGIGKFYSLSIPFIIFGGFSLFTRHSLFEKKIRYFDMVGHYFNSSHNHLATSTCHSFLRCFCTAIIANCSRHSLVPIGVFQKTRCH